VSQCKAVDHITSSVFVDLGQLLLAEHNVVHLGSSIKDVRTDGDGGQVEYGQKRTRGGWFR